MLRAHPDAVIGWDFMAHFEVPKVIDNEVCDLFRAPGAHILFQPHEGAREFVDWLRQSFEVYAVTAPWKGPHWTHDRDEWLHRHFGFDRKHVAHLADKKIVVGDFLIDDKLANVQEWQEAHPSGCAILWRMPHNRREA